MPEPEPEPEMEQLLAKVAMLPPEDQKTFIERAAQFGAPTDQRTVAILWYIIIGVLGVVVVLGMALVFTLLLQDKGTAVIVGFVSAALGALIGLVAPSPVTQKG